MAALASFSFPKPAKGASAAAAAEGRASGRLKNKGKVRAALVVDAATRLLVRKQRLAQLESDNYVEEADAGDAAYVDGEEEEQVAVGADKPTKKAGKRKRAAAGGVTPTHALASPAKGDGHDAEGKRAERESAAKQRNERKVQSFETLLRLEGLDVRSVDDIDEDELLDAGVVVASQQLIAKMPSTSRLKADLTRMQSVQSTAAGAGAGAAGAVVIPKKQALAPSIATPLPPAPVPVFDPNALPLPDLPPLPPLPPLPGDASGAAVLPFAPLPLAPLPFATAAVAPPVPAAPASVALFGAATVAGETKAVKVRRVLGPPPNYLSAAATPSVYPARHFCSACGQAAASSCVRCGLRYCSPICEATHRETRCQKFTS